MAKKVNIGVLGYTGMLGQMVSSYLKGKDLNVFLFGRNQKEENCIEIDIYDTTKLEILLQNNQIDVLVNCIGVLVHASEENKQEALYINSYLPHVLSQLCQKINSKFIHISTDCVFSGKTNFFYEVDHPKDAEDFYGKTKSLGEYISDKSIVIRTSIIGPDVRANWQGLFNWFFFNDKVVSGYSNAMWSGVTTLELSKYIKYLIFNFNPGIYQVSNGTAISKKDLLNLINDVFGLNKTIISNDSLKISKCLIPSENVDFIFGGYTEMLEELFRYMKNNPDLYKKMFETKV
jgi:dTDP-4-dehydrorhamnose reductase